MPYSAWHDFSAAETLTATLMDAIINNLKAMSPVGSYTMLCNSATTAETFVDGVWLECNGVSVLRATYPDLNTKLSGLSYPFGTVDGTHFTLPDAQGRAPVSMASGGHADVNAIGDSDGLAKASRSPQHNSTDSLTVTGAPSLTGAPSIGTLASSGGPYVATPSQVAVTGAGTGMFIGGSSSSPSVVGAPGIGTLASGIGTLAVGGSVGPGGTRPDNTISYLVAGTLFIKAVA